MRGNAVVFFPPLFKNLQLLEPIEHCHESDDGEQPVHGVGGPPVLHEAKEVVRGKEVIDK